MKFLWFLKACVLITIFLNSAFAIGQANDAGNLMSLSDSREKEIGLEAHKKMLAGSLIYKDEKLQEYIEKVGNRIAAASDRPDLDYTFTIIDTPEINAFASPGGYIYINRGLLAFMNDEAELAAVLGHEIAHVTAKHGTQRQSRGKLADFAAKGIGFATAVATGSGYVGQQLADIASIYAATSISGFGRENELEADQLGAEFISKAGYDPQAVIKMLTIFKNYENFNRKTSLKKLHIMACLHHILAPTND